MLGRADQIIPWARIDPLVQTELGFHARSGIHAYEFVACGNRNDLIAFDRDKAARRVARSPIDLHFSSCNGN
jgi:hypothetical protein